MTNRHRQSNPGGPTRASIIVGWLVTLVAVYLTTQAADDTIGYILGALAAVLLLGQTLGQMIRRRIYRETQVLVLRLQEADRTADDHFGGS